MKTTKEDMNALKLLIAELSAKADAGDKDAFIEYAWGVAIYQFLKKGHLLTDLSWFKNTSYYTGDQQIDKAA